MTQMPNLKVLLNCLDLNIKQSKMNWISHCTEEGKKKSFSSRKGRISFTVHVGSVLVSQVLVDIWPNVVWVLHVVECQSNVNKEFVEYRPISVCCLLLNWHTYWPTCWMILDWYPTNTRPTLHRYSTNCQPIYWPCICLHLAIARPILG